MHRRLRARLASGRPARPAPLANHAGPPLPGGPIRVRRSLLPPLSALANRRASGLRRDGTGTWDGRFVAGPRGSERMTFRRFTAISAKGVFVAALLLCAASSAVSAQTPPAEANKEGAGKESAAKITVPKAAAPAEDGQWTLPAKNYANTRYSELNEITPANVGQLKVDFTFSLGVNKGQEAAPDRGRRHDVHRHALPQHPLCAGPHQARRAAEVALRSQARGGRPGRRLLRRRQPRRQLATARSSSPRWTATRSPSTPPPARRSGDQGRATSISARR